MSKPQTQSVDGAEQIKTVTPEDLLSFQLVSEPQINPDGSAIIFTKKHIEKPNKTISNLWLAETKSGLTRPLTRGDKDGHGRWAGDGQTIAFLSARKKSCPQIFLLPLSGGEAQPLTDMPEGSIASFKWSPDGKFIAFLYRKTATDRTEKAAKKREEEGLSTPPHVIDDIWYRLDGDGYFNQQKFHLYIVDVASKEVRCVFTKARAGISSYAWSPDSKELLIAANLDQQPWLKPWKDRIYRLDAKTKKLTIIPNQEDGSRSAAAWSPNGKWITFAGTIGKESVWGAQNQKLFLLDPGTGVQKDLFRKVDYCLVSPVLSDTSEVIFQPTYEWAPDSKVIFAAIGWQGHAHVARINVASANVEFATKGDRQVNMGNISKDGRRMALCCGSAVELNEVYIGTIGRKAVDPSLITHFNRDILKKLELSKPESCWIKAADGTRIQVWIIKPHGYKARTKYPAILQIHGGPHAQYGASFFHEFQVLAAQGYSVFYSNPRGSKGYGEDFCSVIQGDWGNKDWLDIQAVSEFMRGQAFVDADRMGVMGGSYGGYMTNWAIGHTDMFAAAITDRCVSNLVSMAGSTDFAFIPDSYWPGNAWDRTEDLWRQSPIKYMGNAKTPTLIIHSEGDLRCNIEQAEQVFAALKIQNIPARFVRYPASTSHGMSRGGPSDLRIHRLEQILEWLKAYLKKI